MTPRTLHLDADQRTALEQIRDHDKRPYRREKAAALLKVAEGYSAHFVARHGLLKPRDPDTLYGWLDAFEQGGVDTLSHAPRRRRFSPL